MIYEKYTGQDAFLTLVNPEEEPYTHIVLFRNLAVYKLAVDSVYSMCRSAYGMGNECDRKEAQK